jgi:tetratricopeptide (TPR) repeat protein
MSGETSAPSPDAKPDPGLRASFELFEEQYFLNGQWGHLAELYRERIASPSLADDPEERARLWLRLARVQEEKVGDEDAAIASYRECVALSSEPGAALRRLRGLYMRRRGWATVLQVAELEIETLRNPLERSRLLHEMGDIWEQELGDSEQAQVLHASARELEGESARPFAPAGQGGPATVSRARDHADAGEVESAVAVLRERLAGEPTDLEALDLLFCVLESAGRHAELPAVLEQRAAQATDGETRADLLVRLGALHEQVLADPDAARVAYERAMGADPGNAEAGVALGRLYRASEAHESLRKLLETRIALAPPEAQVALRAELDELDADARDEAEPAQVSAGAALAERLCELEAEGAGTSPPAIRLRLRLAELALDGDDDVARAIAVLSPCVEDDAALPQVGRALRQLYQRSGDHRALVALAQRAAEASPDPSERADWHRAAAAAARDAGDLETVVRCLECVLAETPGDVAAEDALLELRRARGEARPLLALIRRALHRAPPGGQASLHAEAAALLQDRLGDFDGAFVHWRRAVALEPGDQALLERALPCAQATGGPLRRLDLLELAAGAASLPRERARLLARRGALLTDTLTWTEEGVESWRQSLELDPDQPEVRERLAACAAA